MAFSLKIRARMNRPDIFPPVDREYAEAVGYVAISWATVEGALATVVRKLLRLEGPAGEALLSEMPYLAVINLITVLIDLTIDRECITGWRKILAIVEPLRAERNLIIHGNWLRTRESHYVSKTKAKQKMTHWSKTYTPAEIYSLASKCSEAADAVFVFLISILQGSGISRIHECDMNVRDDWFTQSLAQAQAPKPTKPVPYKDRRRSLSSAQKRALREKKGDTP